MYKKMSAARRGLFLKALEETGNVTLAAERAKVSRSWVLKARKEDPAFDAACGTALAAARARLGGAAARRPPDGWGHLDGEELVVKGTRSGAARRRVQIARARLDQITPSVEDRFLAVLAATCNVKAACSEAGISGAAIYNHARRWPAFARRWEAAVEEGQVQLEFALLEYMSNPFSTQEPPADAARAEAEADRALHCLHMHKHRVQGIGRRPGRRARLPPIDEVTARIVRAAETVKRARGLSDKDRAASEREWEKRRLQGR